MMQESCKARKVGGSLAVAQKCNQKNDNKPLRIQKYLQDTSRARGARWATYSEVSREKCIFDHSMVFMVSP